MELSVLIVNWNTGPLLAGCLRSLERSQARRPQVVVVDNGSQDESPALVRRDFPWVELLELPRNVGFAAGNNAGLARCRGEAVLLLNSDTRVEQDLSPLLGPLDEAGVGATAPVLRNEDGSEQPSARAAFPTSWELLRDSPLSAVFGAPGWVAAGLERRVAWVTGAALCVRRGLLQEVGGLDEGFFMYFEETDLLKRLAERGWRLVLVPEVEVVHLGGGSSQGGSSPAAVQQFYRSLLRYAAKHRLRGRSALRGVLAVTSLLRAGEALVRRDHPRRRAYGSVVRACLLERGAR